MELLTASVTVIIPNYNGIRYLRGCLDAMRNQTMKARVVVVDNASEDGSCRIAEEEYPEVSLLRMERNTGFTGAVIAGIAEAKDSRYVILLNNDTVPDPEFVRELVTGMEAHPDAFSAQAKMLSLSDPSVLDDAGDLFCALGWAFGLGKGKPDSARYNRERRIFASCGGAAIYRTDRLLEIGGFDDNHFAYLEDADVGWRAQIFGYRNYYLPKAVVLHAGSAVSGSRHNAFKVKLSARNSVYLIWKNMPVLQRILNAPLLGAGFLIKRIFFTKKGLGDAYREGLAEGRDLCRKAKTEGKKVPFSAVHLPAYFRIEGQLLWNCFRRLSDR